MRSAATSELVGATPGDRPRTSSETMFSPALAMSLVLVTGLVYWLWFGATQRAFGSDESISTLAIRGIVGHGYPELPSGYIYYRGLATNYLTALPVFLFGDRTFALVFTATLLSLGSLIVTYLLGRDVLGRPWVGVAAAALLVALELQTFYATSPRMYMGFQLFTLLGVYGAWRGFVEGHRGFQWLAFVGVLCAITQHHQAGALLVAVPAGVVLVRWLRPTRPSEFSIPMALGMLAVLGVVFLYVLAGPLPGRPPSIVASGAGTNQGGVPLNPLEWIDLTRWAYHAARLELALPLTAPLVPLFLVIALQAVRQRHDARLHGFLFTLAIFSLSAVATLFVIKSPASRFWVFVLPLLALLLVNTVVLAVEWLRQTTLGSVRGGSRGFALAVAGSLAVGFLPILVGSSVLYGPTAYLGVVAGGFGKPCEGLTLGRGKTGSGCQKKIEASYEQLLGGLSASDLLISSHPHVTEFYLRRIDGYLRDSDGTVEGDDEDGFSITAEMITDEYFGIPLVGSPRTLEPLLKASPRVWVVTQRDVRQWWLSDETRAMVGAPFRVFSSDEEMTVYVSDRGAP